MLTYREAMEQAKLDLTELANTIGMSKQNLQQKIDYERQFKDYELLKFCKETKQKPSNLRIKGYNY